MVMRIFILLYTCIPNSKLTILVHDCLGAHYLEYQIKLGYTFCNRRLKVLGVLLSYYRPCKIKYTHLL